MGIEAELSEFFTELNEASARMDSMLSDAGSVIADASSEMNKRKEDIGILVGILAEGMRRGQAEDLEAVSQAIATLYMLGFYDGKQKGESQ